MTNLLRPSFYSVLPTLAVAVGLPVLAAGLPGDGFVVGDVGVKFIAAREAIAHPSRPFEVDPPSIGGKPAPDFLEQFFEPHGPHAHATTSFAFPVTIAPFVALLGMRGAYVVPMLSFVGLVATMVAWARALQTRAPPALAGWSMALLSPLLFYALECWEHVPAALCVAMASGLATAGSRPRRDAVAAGFLLAFGILLRPEAAWSALAVTMVLAIEGKWASVALVTAAAAAGVLPTLLYNARHFGTPWGSHVSSNLALLQTSWLAARWDIVRLWFGSWKADGSLWATFPFALLALLQPVWTARTRSLWILAAVPLLCVVLTAPNDGGSQWGPRYLLIIVPPLLLLALEAAVTLTERRGRARWVAAAAVAVAVIAGLSVTRHAYRDLRGAKRLHASLTHDIASLHGAYVVTDLWWLDQLAAAADPRPTFLYVDDRTKLETLLRTLDEAGVARFVAVRGSGASAVDWTTPWPVHYVSTFERRISVRSLVATVYTRVDASRKGGSHVE